MQPAILGGTHQASANSIEPSFVVFFGLYLFEANSPRSSGIPYLLVWICGLDSDLQPWLCLSVSPPSHRFGSKPLSRGKLKLDDIEPRCFVVFFGLHLFEAKRASASRAASARQHRVGLRHLRRPRRGFAGRHRGRGAVHRREAQRPGRRQQRAGLSQAEPSEPLGRI